MIIYMMKLFICEIKNIICHKLLFMALF